MFIGYYKEILLGKEGEGRGGGDKRNNVSFILIFLENRIKVYSVIGFF